MYLDKDLNFNLPIKEKMSKPMKRIGVIQKLTKTLPWDSLIVIHKSLLYDVMVLPITVNLLHQTVIHPVYYLSLTCSTFNNGKKYHIISIHFEQIMKVFNCKNFICTFYRYQRDGNRQS